VKDAIACVFFYVPWKNQFSQRHIWQSEFTKCYCFHWGIIFLIVN